jgi:tetratricopeptide (TPR) repeat protein
LTDYEWDWAGAQEQYELAIELNPSYVTAHYWYADHLSRMARHDEAIERAAKAGEIDPMSPLSTFFSAWTHFWARKYDRSVELAREAVELEPAYLAAWRLLGWGCEERGRYADAIDAHSRAAALSGGSPQFEGQLGRPYALSGRTADARGVAERLVERSRQTPISALDVAIIHAAVNDTDRAFEWLEKARDEHSEHIPYLKVNPRVDSLRTDPRFDAILSSMNLAD